MRKILLLTFIGGLGFSPQVLNVLDVTPHLISVEYKLNQIDAQTIGAKCRLPQQSKLFLPISTIYKVITKSPFSAPVQEHQISVTQKAFIPEGFIEGHWLLSPRTTIAHSTFHFNRLVNRKRILLSG